MKAIGFSWISLFLTIELAILSTSQASPGFTGEEQDSATGAVFLRSRYYDPESGTLLTKDPTGTPNGFNGYQYCASDPVNNTDPNGQFVHVIAGAVIGGLVGVASRFAVDVVNAANGGNWSSANEYAAAGAGGAAFGAVAAINPFGAATAGQAAASLFTAGAVGGATSSTYSQTLNIASGNQDHFSFTALGIETGVGGAFAGASSYAGGVASSVIRANINSTTAGTIGEVVGSATAITKGEVVNPATLSIFGPQEVYGATGSHLDARTAFGKIMEFKSDWTENGAEEILTPITSMGRLKPPQQATAAIEGLGDNYLAFQVNVTYASRLAGGSFGYYLGENTVGGVLLDKAAALVGQNLSEISGAMYDPVSGQFVILGTNTTSTVKNINLDYLYTALQAVYGSAQPPFVTLSPSASAYTAWTDFGNGNGIFEPWEYGGLTIRYNPIWPNVDTTVDVIFFVTQNGTPYQWRARFACQPQTIYAGWRQGMKMVFSNWVTDTYATLPPSGIQQSTGGWSMNLNADGQDSYTGFYLFNGAGANFNVNSVLVVPAVQQREFGGRVENSKVGWVMEEADRVMKCLAIGTDNLTGDQYNSGTISPNLQGITGYQNMMERISASGVSQTLNLRFWFTPNQMTLQQYVDPTTGLASIIFTNSSVSLNTEAFMQGLPQSAQAKAFADNFTANYNSFATLKFPCHDPNDATGQTLISTNIFGMLRDVMKAVSLARFFRDNNVPVDMWWLNSWQCPVAYTPKSVPTAGNVSEDGGIVLYGGVQINQPNAYIPSVTASNVAFAVKASRPDSTGNANGDIQQQIWTNTTGGNYKAVALNSTSEPLDGNVNLREVDLTFASPGAMRLTFARYYQSSWLGSDAFGPGWRYTPFVLQFERPSWFDQTHLMVDAATNQLLTYNNGDTGLRSGQVRLVNLSSGAALDFQSSMVMNYTVNNVGNPVISVAGLTADDVPVFTPGQRQNGTTLAQDAWTMNYKCATPDGQSLTFDFNGRLLQTQDRYGRVKNYTYDGNGHLTQIADDAGQTLTFGYDPTTNYITSVTGPANEEVIYGYTNGLLATATHVRSGAYVSYAYNTNKQLLSKTAFNGLKTVVTQPDLKGRASTNYNYRSNLLVRTFTQDRAGQTRTNTITDPRAGAGFVPQRRQFDRSGRLLAHRNTTGAETSYGYNAGSLLPNAVALPIAGRPAITIQRDAHGRPTRVTDPGNIGACDVTAVYDPVTKQLQQVSDEAGRSTSLYYNGNHHVNHIQRTHYGASGAQTVDVGMNYTGSGALYQITDPLNNTAMTIQRDTLDRATNVVDATGVSQGCEYDTLGRLSKLRDPRLSSAVVYHYDDFDRVTEVDYPSGTNYYNYDPDMGWLVSKTDMLGRTTRYDRDPKTGDVLQIVQMSPGGPSLTTVMSYDRFGNLATITPPQSATISYNFDSIGRPLGTSYSGTSIPGAPNALVCNLATNGMATIYTNLVFSWQPPVSSAGVRGYSCGFDEMPGNVTNIVGTNAAVNNINIGAHLFQVKAQDTNGMWGPTADFQLVVGYAPGHVPPGAPAGLSCSATTDGVPTYTASNITFTWQVPTSENGIGGYSYATNATPATTIKTTATTVTFATVPIGATIFQVMAKGSNGVWGPTSSFTLIVQTTPPVDRSIDTPLLPPWGFALLAILFAAVGYVSLRRRTPLSLPKA